MSIYNKVLRTDVIYWEKAFNADDETGQPTYNSPIPLRCRFDDWVEELNLPDGRTVFSKAAYMLSADVKPGGILMLGLKDDDTPSIPPTDNEGAHEILLYKKYGNIRQTKFLRQAWV